MVNVVAIQRGVDHPNRYIIMSGDIDSRISDPLNGKDDSPEAYNNGSEKAGTIEAARLLIKYKLKNSIVYTDPPVEEQRLFKGKQMAKVAEE